MPYTKPEVFPHIELTARGMSPIDVLYVAKANFEALTMAFPTLADVPLYRIAKMQLDDALQAMTKQPK
jgi:hypothetical protein